MNQPCESIRPYLSPYLDRELDLERSLVIESHLKECGECRNVLASYSALRRSMQGNVLYHKAPALVRQNLVAKLATLEPQPGSILSSWKTWTLAGALAIALLVVWKLNDRTSNPPGEQLVAQEMVDSHIRSLVGNHLMDVGSTDQHTVKPWFDGKVDFSPEVRDLSAQGYVLLGGRLDYVDGRSFAALVYRRRLHIINLYTSPTVKPDRQSTEVLTRQGYSVYTWIKGRMEYWAVSDLNNEELREFTSSYER